MNWTARLTWLSLLLTTGCLVHAYPCDKEGPARGGAAAEAPDTEDTDPGGGFVDGGDTGTTDTGGDLFDDTPPVLPTDFSVTPDEAPQGEAVTVELVAADGDPFDHTDIFGVAFDGPITICALELVEDRAVLSIVADPDAALGPVDLYLDLGEDEALVIDGALDVVLGSGGLVFGDPCG